jgi:hypothetical protein
MLRLRTTSLAALVLAWVASSSCKSETESDTGAEDTTSGSSTTGLLETGSSESSSTTPASTTDTTTGDDGKGSINCGPTLCSEGLLCVREITLSREGEPVSEWFCRSKPDTCGDAPGDCACAIAVCYNDPCTCEDTGANRFTCTNDGTCGGGTETGTGSESTDTGADTGADDTTSDSSSTGA